MPQTTQHRRSHYVPDPRKSVQLTARDLRTLAIVKKYRFVTSRHILQLVDGSQKSEILTLEWRDVRGDMIRLRPEIAKNKDGRMIILVGELSNIIDRRRVERVESCPYIFHRKGIRIKHYNRAWRTAREKAGLPSKLFHDSRRTAVRNMDRAGVPRQTAKQITGHKTDAVYNRYRIVNEQDIREGMAQAQAYLAAQKNGHHTDIDIIRDDDHSLSY